MTNDEYLEAQNQITIFAAMLIEVDVEGLLDRASRADAIAPLLDPTLWMKGHERLDAIKELALGAMAFKQAACKFRNTMARIEAEEKARAARGR